MAKTIKFNLICDEQPVRTLEDLRNNFSIEDVLEYYNNGLLARWLTVRGYQAELEKVEAITAKEDNDILLSLIKIFQVSTDEDTIKENLQILRYKKERLEAVKRYEEGASQMEKIVSEYNEGYLKLVLDIVTHKDDLPVIKAAVGEIHKKYMRIFEVDYQYLFSLFSRCAPMAILVMLIHDDMRRKYLDIDTKDAEHDKREQPQTDIKGYSSLAFVSEVMRKMLAECNEMIEGESELAPLPDVPAPSEAQLIISLVNVIRNRLSNLNESGDGESSPFAWATEDALSALDNTINSDRKSMYIRLCNIISKDINTILGRNLKEFTGTTESYWKDLEPKGQRFMILHMDKGSNIRPTGQSGTELRAEDINNKFLILNGIDYRNNQEGNKLLYMEV